jgi:L-seryl-tRNA(Ser) seleniumtransferase
MDIYDRLGVQKVINAQGTVTVLGGSIMDPRVLDVMKEASQHHILMEDLLGKAGERVAELAGVEAAFITSGASAGCFLATAALIAGDDPARMSQLPDTTGMQDEIIICKCQRYSFDQAFRLAGGKLVEIGNGQTTHAWEMEAAITDRTAFCVWVPTINEEMALPFATFVEIAKRHDLPVLVDPAAEIPPVANLRKWTDEGADVVIFSGGKSLRGPQSTGLILGRKQIIEACRANSSPNTMLGRPVKVGKEEICGLVAALELYVDEISKTEGAVWEAMVARILAALQGLDGVRAWRQFPHNPTKEVPVVVVELAEDHPLTPEDVLLQLREGDPPIWAIAPSRGFGYTPGQGFVVKVQGLQPGQDEVVATRLRAVLGGGDE